MVYNSRVAPVKVIETSYKGSRIKYFVALEMLLGTFEMTIYIWI